MSENFTDESRKNWTRQGQATMDDILVGCAQRIAAAVELSCKDREKLERDYRYMRDDRDRYRNRLDTEKRRNAALRGQITKLRAAAAIAKGEKA